MELNEELILRVLSNVSIEPKNFVAFYIFRNTNDVFKLLIATILTQNTSDRNALRAYENLVRTVGDVAPRRLLEVGEEAIANAIRVAGMYRARARKIIELSRVVLERFGGDLSWIKDLPVDEARKILLDLPGVGEKTADVVLVNLGKPVFPVDTHIMRISLRLGIARSRKYSEVSNAWMRLLRPDPRKYLDVHLRLIQFGREICRARNPRCEVCGFRDVCRYYNEVVKRKGA
jgi:endonuclease-3